MFFKRKKMVKISSHGNESGFMILYAVLVSTVIITIGLAVLGIMIQHLTLTSTERDSQIAFYAADTAMECALYWDILQDVFNFQTGTGAGTVCNNFTPTITKTSIAGTPKVYNFNFDVSLPDNTCAHVLIQKYTYGTSPETLATTTISTRGYNTPFSTTCTTVESVRRLERGLRVTY
jgi:Tfp pilus assembly protein PilX